MKLGIPKKGMVKPQVARSQVQEKGGDQLNNSVAHCSSNCSYTSPEYWSPGAMYSVS